jgi:anti-sigma B factor antagonist
VGLSVEVRTGLAGALVIVVGGELQQSTSELLRQAVKEALTDRPAGLVIDLALVTFIDSSGLSALVAARHAGDRVGCRVSLSGVGPVLRRTLHTTGLTDYLNANETPD